MDLGLTGKVAFVAGASEGLGWVAARELSLEGARVAISARTDATLREAAAAIQQETGNEVLAVPADVTERAQVEAAIAHTVAHFGALHVLVANAGGAAGGRVADLSDDAWQRGWALNFMSTLHLARAAIPHLRAAGWGRIIAITSLSVREPLPDLVISSAVRPGVAGLVRVLATELAPHNITVNNVAPGYTATARVRHIFEERAARDNISEEAARAGVVERIPMGRMADPAEQAAVIAFLASERASFLTGQTILVDGGQVRDLM